MSGVPGEINDNPDPIKPGDAVNFPTPLVNPYGTIQRVAGSASQFTLPPGSVFEITFQVSLQVTGELVIVLNGNELLMTIVGKSGNGTIIGISIISTPFGGSSTLSINNPSNGKVGGLIIDSATGNLTQPLSCHLIIKQLM
jgi:hypothetical protein